MDFSVMGILCVITREVSGGLMNTITNSIFATLFFSHIVPFVDIHYMFFHSLDFLLIIIVFRYDAGIVTPLSIWHDDCRRPRRVAPAADR